MAAHNPALTQLLAALNAAPHAGMGNDFFAHVGSSLALARSVPPEWFQLLATASHISSAVPGSLSRSGAGVGGRLRGVYITPRLTVFHLHTEEQRKRLCVTWEPGRSPVAHVRVRHGL